MINITLFNSEKIKQQTKKYKRDPQQTLRCPSVIFTNREEADPDASVILTERLAKCRARFNLDKRFHSLFLVK